MISLPTALRPPGTMTGKLKLVALMIAILLQFVFLAAAIRLRSSSPLLESFPHTYHMLTLTLIGMTPWETVIEDSVLGFVVVLLFITLHLMILCGIISILSYELSNVSVPFVNRLSSRFATIRASMLAGLTAKYEGPEGDSWLKRNLPGWYYKVTLPDHKFKRQVAQSKAFEDGRLLREMNCFSEPTGRTPQLEALDSLKTVSDDFAGHIMQIHASMRTQTTKLKNRIIDVRLIVDELKSRMELNSS